MKKVSLMKIKKLATYVKKNLILIMMMVMMTMMMMATKSIMKSKIIVITMENLKELLIVLVI